jgi:hypothetical protein
MKFKHLKRIVFALCFLLTGMSAYSQSGSTNSKVVEGPSLAGGLAGLGAAGAQANITVKKDTPQIQPINVDGAKMSDFLIYENSCKLGNSQACLAAGKIMMADKPPQEIFNLSFSARAKKAIRFYEAAISSGNNLEAMELAYDLYYDKNILDRNLNSYTDKERAKELMDSMLAKSYPGGQIRQARDYIEDPEYLLSIGKKKEACATARSIARSGDISPSTKIIADEMLTGNICLVYNK